MCRKRGVSNNTIIPRIRGVPLCQSDTADALTTQFILETPLQQKCHTTGAAKCMTFKIEPWPFLSKNRRDRSMREKTQGRHSHDLKIYPNPWITTTSMNMFCSLFAQSIDCWPFVKILRGEEWCTMYSIVT